MNKVINIDKTTREQFLNEVSKMGKRMRKTDKPQTVTAKSDDGTILFSITEMREHHIGIK